MANWTSLPCDILSEIAQKLDAVEDFIYFSIVSHQFHYACSLVKQNLAPRMPWLMLTENTNNNPECRRKFFNLSKNKSFELKVPQTFGTRCWGSSCGLVVTIDLQKQLHLFNPLTKAIIPLPPRTTIPVPDRPFIPVANDNYSDDDDVDEDDEDLEDEIFQDVVEENEWMRNLFLEKAIVVEESHGSYLVFVIIGLDNMRTLSFARPNDKNWTSVVTPMARGLIDKKVQDICSDGQRIYILYYNGDLRYVNISDVNGSQPVIAVGVFENLHPPQVIKEKLFHEEYRRFCGMYIVKSPGNLLMVIRYMRDVIAKPIQLTANFEVYRLNLGLTVWEKINNLGDDIALFVGCNDSMSVQASAIGSFKSNCIYFTDDGCEQWTVMDVSDMGFFDMASGEIESFYDGEDVMSKHCTPLWFVPRF